MAGLATATAGKRPINLMRGWPSPDLLPIKHIAGACQRLLANPAENVPILQYGPDQGYQPLKECLAQWLGRHYGVKPDAERICVTGGASQNLACVLQSFSDVNYTRAVWMVAPTYYLAAGIFADAGFGGRLMAVPEDDEGIDLDALESAMSELEGRESAVNGDPFSSSSHQRRPFKQPGPQRKLYRHIIYAVPTCANPSDKTMTLRRRQGLVQLARRHDALVICDDVYDFLQWPLEGPPTPERSPELRLPRLCDIDMSMGRTKNDPMGFGYAISNGSFSKVAGPGMRTGWVEATPAFALGLSKTGSTMSGGPPSQFCAGVLAELLGTGELQDFIEETTRPALQRRHRLMMDAIRDYLVPHGVTAPKSSIPGHDIYGGYFIWLTLPPGAPSSTLLKDVAMEEEAIIIGQGQDFAVPGDDKNTWNSFDDKMRLSFSWEPEEDIVDAVKRLGGLIHRMQKNPDLYEEQSRRGLTKESATFA